MSKKIIFVSFFILACLGIWIIIKQKGASDFSDTSVLPMQENLLEDKTKTLDQEVTQNERILNKNEVPPDFRRLIEEAEISIKDEKEGEEDEMTVKEVSDEKEISLSSPLEKGEEKEEIKTKEVMARFIEPKKEAEEKMPEEINLSVPFIPQAPYAKWDELHGNACEEAILIMVHYFLQEKSLSPQKAEGEILALVDFQNKNFGGHHHLDAKGLLRLAEYYGYKNSEIFYDITLEDIRKEVSQGYPVIIPCAGRLLGNPYYQRPGPLYHMLVIRGYSKDHFFTNDPGTKRGENLKYSPGVLYNAIHDWHEDNILKGRKTMVVIKK